MIVGKQQTKAVNFSVSINHNVIEQKNDIKYLGVVLNDKLLWEVHIANLHKNCLKLVV